MSSKPTKKHSSSSDEIWVTEFTQEAAQEFREKLLEESRENPSRPIIVYIDSYGGQVDALAKMIATMDEIPNPIITACMGKSMSCGAILLSHGDVRFCDPHSRVMIHRVSSWTQGDTNEMKNDVAETERLNKYWLGFLATNSNMDDGYDDLEKYIKSKDGSDRYLTAAEAKKFKIVDVVGRPKIVSATIYEVVSGPDKITIQKRARMRAEYKKEVKPTTKKKVSKRRAK